MCACREIDGHVHACMDALTHLCKYVVHTHKHLGKLPGLGSEAIMSSEVQTAWARVKLDCACLFFFDIVALHGLRVMISIT